MRQLFPFTLLLLLIPPVPQSTGGSPQEATIATSFHHVHLNSTDPSKAIEYYTRAFIHVHLYSDAPLCVADWYVKRLGATSRAQRGGPCEVPFAAPSEPLGVIRSPAATVRFGEISLIIYPRQRPGPLVSPRGHVVDHIALSIPDLAGALDRLRKSGVKVLEELHQFGDSKMRAAMIEGPDSIAIELIEAAPRP